MEKKTFKSFYSSKLQDLNNEILLINRKLKNLPSEENITLPTGEELTELRHSYLRHHRRSIKSRLLGISKKDLQKHFLEMQKSELTKSLKEKLQEINELKSSYKENQDKTTILPSTAIIKAYLNYAKEYKIPASTILDFLISIFHNDLPPKNVLSTIEKDIISYFNIDNTFDTKETNTIIFLFKKLFDMVLKDKITDYEDLIASINEEIKERGSKRILSSDEKYTLLVQRKAVDTLKTYIKGNKVIKSSDNINDFIRLLEDAKVEEKQAKIYAMQMIELIQSNEEEMNNALVSKNVSQEEYNIFMQAKSLLATLPIEEQQKLLSRLIKDIISICKYINMGIVADELNDAREVLFTKIDLLRSQLKILTNPPTETSTFRYVTNNEGIPLIIRNIEGIDIMSYKDIYYALKSLSPNAATLPSFTTNGFDFYVQKASDVNIVYTIINGRIVLVSATAEKDISKISSDIYYSSLTCLAEMASKPTSDEDNLVEQNYENLLIKLLDLDNTLKPKVKEK